MRMATQKAGVDGGGAMSAWGGGYRADTMLADRLLPFFFNERREFSLKGGLPWPQ